MALNGTRFVSVPSSGDYQFLRVKSAWKAQAKKFPSPHPGIINFFIDIPFILFKLRSFRPLIRGLSISSWHATAVRLVASSFRPLIRGLSISSRQITVYRSILFSFRPLIRGLSISSCRSYALRVIAAVSVPSSGDYQFLRQG